MTPRASLVYVVTSSKRSLDQLVAELERTPSGHKSLASLLSAICREADTLSAALARLASQGIDQLPEITPRRSDEDRLAMLDQAQRFIAIVHGRECPSCGGALREEHGA